MKKALHALGILVIFAHGVVAQYSNDWIEDHSQTYVKVQVTEAGIYRIPYGVLQARIPNLSSITPDRFQVFARGEEQYIYVQGESNNTFHSSQGYIEFFAEGNDGWLDEGLYADPDHQPHRQVSLFNDTISYFLTFNAGGGNRRMNEVGYSAPPGIPVNFILKETFGVSVSRYVPGPLDNAGKSNPEYSEGEGWYSGEFGFSAANPFGNGRNIKVINRHLYTGADAPNVSGESVFTGISNPSGFVNNHKVQITYRNAAVNNPVNTLDNITYNAYDLQRPPFSVNPNNLGPDSTTFIFTTTTDLWGNVFPVTDKSVVSNVSFTYPHKPEFGGATDYEFIFPAGSSFLDADDFTPDANAFIYDLTSHNRIAVDASLASNGQIRANIPNTGVNRRCFLSSNGIAAVTNVNLGNFQLVNGTGQFTDYNELANQGDYILITHPKLWSNAQAYASYRNNEYNTLMVDVNELYDQFGYGIPKHPLSIRFFADYAINNFTEVPQHLFLVGKSVTESRYRTESQYYDDNLVPTIGFPAGDNLFTSGLGSTLYEPAIPLGRLSAQTPEEVDLYLDKVQEFEADAGLNTIENRLWKKRLLHFGGGANTFEQNKFRGYLENYTQTISDTAFGGEVTSFYKTSNNPIQFTVSEGIKDLLRDGVAMMTFFGHAGGGSFDISIDDPKDWGNQGKYPLVLANSCFTGDIHQPPSPVPSTSESYVLIEDRGAIAYIASVDLGYEDLLNVFSARFYRELSSASYGQPLAVLLQRAIRNTQAQSNERLKYTLLEMTLHGDPALRLHPYDQPDFAIERPSVSFDPEILNTESDSFDLVLDIFNLGRGVRALYNIQVTRFFPNGSEPQIYAQEVEGTAFHDEVIFTLPIDPINGIGENEFEILVDYSPLDVQGAVAEFDDVTNNRITVTRLITSNDVFPVFPRDYAVVPSREQTLRASTGDPFAPETNYILQLDTTDFYNSPLLQEQQVSQAGGVVSWEPNLGAISDSGVVFWRISPTDTAGDGPKWQEHTFQYIDGQRGWGQDHFFQLEDNSFSFMSPNRSTRTFDLNDEARKLDVKVLGNPNTAILSELLINEYRLDGIMQEHSICIAGPGMNVVVIDSLTLRPWGTRYIDSTNLGNVQEFNLDHDFGNLNDLSNCRDRVEFFFAFNVADPVSMDSMANMLTNRVPDGHYILAYTVGSGQFSNINFWQDNHFLAFENMGAQNIRSVDDDVPYIFFGRKGHPSEGQEVIGTSSNELITFSTPLQNSAQQGFINSTTIGPAWDWQSLHWGQRSLDNPVSDSVLLSVFGITESGSEVLLAELPLSQPSLSDLGSIADASIYPYLRLQFYSQDILNQTAAQLQRWHVLYEGVPELAINPTAGDVFESAEIPRGGVFKSGLAVQNVSDLDFGPLRVDYRLVAEDGSEVDIPYPERAELKAGDILFDTISLQTNDLNSGRYTFWMEVNPRDSVWVPEQFHFNNIAYRSFKISRDQTNPLLDVTFDGIHILDGDLVSAQPQVAILLKDENPFLLVDDTSMLDVYITPPNMPERRVPYIRQGEVIMQFTPPDGSKNRARIDLQPDLPIDGEYTLRVRARDASGNYSGQNDYRLRFEVVNRSEITHLLNYPNPFTTSTRFVFTLTGSRVPDYVKIQIMTVTGKVVREITTEELGPLNIGNNMTEYAWDGTDEFGDRLANGVYLYRVIAKIDGENIEHRSTSADRFFHRGFGKMYLMR